MPTRTRSSNLKQAHWNTARAARFQPTGPPMRPRLNDLLPLRTLLSLVVGDEPDDQCPVVVVNQRWTAKQSRTISG
ncbi:MAG: hypothetical protein ACKV22_21150 [Bryobacteraceae bacterium]